MLRIVLPAYEHVHCSGPAYCSYLNVFHTVPRITAHWLPRGLTEMHLPLPALRNVPDSFPPLSSLSRLGRGMFITRLNVVEPTPAHRRHPWSLADSSAYWSTTRMFSVAGHNASRAFSDSANPPPPHSHTSTTGPDYVVQ